MIKAFFHKFVNFLKCFFRICRLCIRLSRKINRELSSISENNNQEVDHEERD